MKYLRPLPLSAIVILSVALLPSCAPKKAVVMPPPQVSVAYPPDPPPAQKPAPAPTPAPAPAPEPAAPAPAIDYSFTNIQFEFNSGILKTDSYPIMDKAASAMKADLSIKFNLNGYASAEGNDAHNMALSVERANAVKSYLVNSGVSAASLTAKGFGEANPVADNTTDAGKVLNRRVEIKKVN